MNKEELSRVMYGIAVNYGLTMSNDYVIFMQKMFDMNGITIEQVKKSALKIIQNKSKSYEKMPNYAEFAEYIQGNREQIAETEAMRVIRLIRSEGAYKEPALEPATKQVIKSRFGSWMDLCGSLEESKIQWFIRDFKEAYLSMSDNIKYLPDVENGKEVLMVMAGGK